MSDLIAEQGVAAGRRHEWRRAAIAVLVASYLLTFVVRYGTAVVLPQLRADLDVGEVALGALAAAYFWPYALMQPVAGILADTWGARNAVAAFLALAAGGTALFATSASFPIALFGRALGGAGVGVVYICGVSLIGQWVSEQRFSTAAGLFSASGILGGFVAARPLDALVEGVGWRWAFALIAAALLGCALLARAVIPARVAGGRGPVRPLRGLGSAARLGNVWLIGAYAFVALGILSSMQGLWTIPFLTDVYALDEGRSAAVLESLSVGLFLGIPFWGVVADRLLRSQRRTILVSLVIQTSVWAFLTVAPTAWPPGLLYGLFLVAGFSNGCWMPAYALVRSTSPSAIGATALGLLNFAFFSGAALFQQATGVLLGRFARTGTDALPTAAYRSMFGAFCAVLLLASVCVAVSRERPDPPAAEPDAPPPLRRRPAC